MGVMDIDELPKWQRVKYDIELKIITGEYQAGELVPSVRNLAKMYGIGTSTSHIILEKLSADGTLIMEQGVGFRVNDRVVKRLKIEHKKRLVELLEEACEYAERIQVDPVAILTQIFASKRDKQTGQ